MKISQTNATPWLPKIQKIIEAVRSRTIRLLLASLVLFSLYTIGIFVFGYYIESNEFFRQTVKPVLKLLVRQNVAIVWNLFRGLTARPEHITIDIKHKHFLKLAQKRQSALAVGLLFTSPDDYIPAIIRYKDRIIRVKLRLKGDTDPHWNGEKWSLRVIVKGDDTLFGMKRFSLNNPKARNHIYEWLYHQALKKEGLLSLRYGFIDVTINGNSMGIYGIEEHFDKRLPEHNRHRNGPIIRFDESIFWLERGLRPLPYSREKSGIGTFMASEIDGFQSTTWLSKPAGRSQYFKAIALLDMFRRGELKTVEVFDVQKLATFFALSDLMGGRHGVGWTNMRFYYNPITSRLEPIGFDGVAVFPKLPITYLLVGVVPQVSPENMHQYWSLLARIFEDIEFFEAYLRQLERVSKLSYLNSFFSEVHGELEETLRFIYRDYPYFDFREDLFYDNQNYIRRILNPVKELHAYYHVSSANHIGIGLGNIQYLPIEILGLVYKNSLTIPTDGKLLLAGRKRMGPVSIRKARFSLPEGVVGSDIVATDLGVSYRILGTSPAKYVGIVSRPDAAYESVKTDLARAKPNVSRFDFLVTDEATSKIYIRSGVWDLNTTLIIPKGYRVMGSPGTTLNLTDAASIVSYSPLDFKGNEEFPIVIQSDDSTGEGLVVISAKETSILEHVVFKNLSAPSHIAGQLTGAVTFYESPVHFSHSQFLGSRSEDALNIVRTQVVIAGTLFRDSFSDAFDGDFVTGNIADSSFASSGNDAIDLSGSVVTLQRVVINGAGDKALSVGENSQMTADHVVIRDAAIGVASKDSSDILISNVEIENSQTGFAAFQKKSEFGSASIKIEGVSMNAVANPYLLEEKSKITVNGHQIEPNRKRLRGLLYKVEKNNGGA